MINPTAQAASLLNIRSIPLPISTLYWQNAPVAKAEKARRPHRDMLPTGKWHNVRMPLAGKIVHATRLLSSLQFDLETVEAGVPVETMMKFVAASGLELKDIYEIVIPARTLKHRRSRKETLSRDESDKLARLVRVFDQAISVFGEVERARSWLNKPKKRFDDRSPLQMLRTDFGGRMVEEMLGQIDEGMFA
jgi:putative toxin-antitoxin system antitoxin component (TIGR02293 family)